MLGLLQGTQFVRNLAVMEREARDSRERQARQAAPEQREQQGKREQSDSTTRNSKARMPRATREWRQQARKIASLAGRSLQTRSLVYSLARALRDRAWGLGGLSWEEAFRLACFPTAFRVVCFLALPKKGKPPERHAGRSSTKKTTLESFPKASEK